jgi:hypothetical protein
VTTVGWKEYADFPGFGLARVRVKLDTGARTAAVGADRCELTADPDGSPAAVLTLCLYPRRRTPKTVTVRVPVVGFVRVRNSGGRSERRPVIETTVRLGGVEKTIRATVADRSRMLTRVILGRSALAPEFVVDPSRKYVLNASARGSRGSDADEQDQV